MLTGKAYGLANSPLRIGKVAVIWELGHLGSPAVA
jgi:hypothetical protein